MIRVVDTMVGVLQLQVYYRAGYCPNLKIMVLFLLENMVMIQRKGENNA